MATPINAPLTSEIWHLSIEDLLEPICESPRLGGPGPFVINLSASSAPLSQPAKTFLPPGAAHVYQIQRMEDRRPRYRLRLGPFATEDEADAMLGIVRDVYPSALTATAESDDLRAIAALQPKPPSATAPAVWAPAVTPPVAAATPRNMPVDAAPIPAASPSPPAPVSVVATPSAPRPAVLTTVSQGTPLRGTAPAPIKSQPPQPAVARAQFPPGAISIPVLSDSVEVVRRPPRAAVVAPPAAVSPAAASPATTPPVVASPAVASPAAASPATVPPVVAPPSKASSVAAPRAAASQVAASPATSAPAAARAPVSPLGGIRPAPRPAPSAVKPMVPVVSNVASPAQRPVVRDARPPSLESTQTLRALTPSELQDSAARWYVIQLSISGESFDPDSLPNLDIFNEYRLYSVAGMDQGRIVHSLRLGFFGDEVAAGAVASYLAEFYEKPTVRRISVAERERFRDQRVEARKDIGATGRHAVIEITGERHIRDNRPRIASVTPLAPAAASSQSTAAPARKGR